MDLSNSDTCNSMAAAYMRVNMLRTYPWSFTCFNGDCYCVVYCHGHDNITTSLFSKIISCLAFLPWVINFLSGGGTGQRMYVNGRTKCNSIGTRFRFWECHVVRMLNINISFKYSLSVQYNIVRWRSRCRSQDFQLFLYRPVSFRSLSLRLPWCGFHGGLTPDVWNNYRRSERDLILTKTFLAIIESSL